MALVVLQVGVAAQVALTLLDITVARAATQRIMDVQVQLVAAVPLILVVHPSVPVKSVKEFIALAKAKPNQVVYASFGVGGVAHFGAELFSHMAGIKMVHVPYKGSGPSTIDLLAGQVMDSFDTMQNAMPYVRAGRMRGLGVASLKRSTVAPEILTSSPHFGSSCLM